ncbi:MAG: nicotinate (nicotinamide) nucleotide adenylyltransferase [Oscillospiraceae bacterium]|nr:nicotinate (nicotinamide) nucleotide adenylyltransferase [Oscillospiraceae bacterium]
MSRVGVYGGSYNPPHTGHVLAASELVRLLKLDRLLIVPAAIPPHKSLSIDSPTPEQRMALCRAAFASIPQAELCDLELRREGPSYTADTLTQLKAQYPEDELILIMGTDMLLTFSDWREPEKIATLATLAVMRREEDDEIWANTCREAERLEQMYHTHVIQVENRCLPVSSTMVRRMIAFGAPCCLPSAVETMIQENGWYLSGANLKDLPFENLRELSLALHNEKRRAHVLGTAQTAELLALRWGADPIAARRAGILHDITKALGEKEQLYLCDHYSIPLTSLQRENPKLLHAKTGAVVAKEIFGESDAVYEAIWWHTTGRAEMTTLEKILYIADYMEPNRSFPGVELLRQLVETNLNAALYRGLDQSISHLREQGRIIDPDSLEGWEYYRKRNERSQPS